MIIIIYIQIKNLILKIKNLLHKNQKIITNILAKLKIFIPIILKNLINQKFLKIKNLTKIPKLKI